MSRLATILIAVSLGCFPACGGDSDSRSDRTHRKSRSKKKHKKKRKDRSRRHSPSKGSKKSADADYRKAIEAEAEQDYEAAEDYYLKAIDRNPAHRRANQHYVHFLIDQKRATKALKVAQRFFRALPGQAVSYHTLADAEAANGQHEQIIGTMSGLLAFSEEDATAFEIRGRARIKVGETKEGIEDIRTAVKMDPENPDFLLSLAGGLMRTKRGKEAQGILHKALRSDPSSGRAHLLLGLLARAQGDKAGAIKHHQEAATLDPSDARVRYELGISYNLAGDDEAAEKAFGQAIDLESGNGTYWYSYADLLRLRGRNEEAAAAYRNSVKRSPANKRAWERLAETLVATGQLGRAAKELKRGIRKVEHPRLHFLLAQIYLQDEQRDLALEELETYLEGAAKRAPDRRAASKMLRRLQRESP